MFLYLHQKGYSKNTIPVYCLVIEHLGQWMLKKSLLIKDINNEIINNFLVNHLQKCRCKLVRRKDFKTVRASLKQFLLFLIHENILIPVNDNKEDRFVDRFLDEYDEYLIKICGVSENTRIYRKRYIREFIKATKLTDFPDINNISPKSIINFIKKYSSYYKSKSLQVVISSLQSLFNYLNFKGFDTKKLLASIPKIPNWRLSEIPGYFSDEEIKKILLSFDRATLSGKRDYAMARFFTDLGLRCSEVAEIALSDINWYEGTLSIAQGKTKKDRLPLLKPLGEAIIDYLQNGRPKTQCNFLFVHHRAPYGEKVKTETVRAAIRQAYHRCGLCKSSGTHILRRSLATRMLHSGTPLKEIADILRHKCIDTTMIYTKIDLPHLKCVALPWVGE